jgi:aspartate aminotransferase
VISDELEALLQPLERFEAIRRRVARLGDRLCDLSYANPYEGAHRASREAIRQTLEEERLLDLQYAPFGGQPLSRRACADALRESHDLPFAAADVVLTPGAMSALQLALRAAGRPGAEAVIPSPCWLDHPLYVRLLDMEPRLVPLPEPDFRLDPEAIAGAVSRDTAVVLLTHPGNPTGRNHPAEALARLADRLREAEEQHGCRVTLIADEVHRDFVPSGEYASVAQFFDRTVLVYSFGKYHFMQGQRLGYAAVSPRHPEREAVAEELVRWTRIGGYATPTALMQRALPRLLGVRHDLSQLAPTRRRLLGALSDAGYGYVEPDGTLFVYVRTPPGYGDDFAFVERLAHSGVLALPAPVFHHSGHFRLSLTASEDMLERALPVLAEAAGR